MKSFLLNVWTKYLCPIFTFVTRVDVVILFSISLLAWSVLKGFVVMHHENVALSKLIALTFEEATDGAFPRRENAFFEGTQPSECWLA
jgi:hypothetical protein